MTSSPEDNQRHFYDFVRMLSAQLPSGLTGTTLVIWTLLVALAVRISMLIANFILWQIHCRKVGKQFPGPKIDKQGNVILTEFEDHDRHYIWWNKVPGPRVACCHPDCIKPGLSDKTQKVPWLSKFFRPWLGDSILFSEGPKWQRNRRLLTPAFHFEILKHYVKLFSESTSVLLDKWSSYGPGTSVELFHHFSLLALDNILKCSLSYESSCQIDGQSAPYVEAVIELTTLILDRAGDRLLNFVDFIYYLTAKGRRFREACKVAHTFSEQLIRRRKEELKKNKFGSSKITEGKHMDLLDILLEAKDEDGTGLTLTEIRDEVNTFLFAGHHTTASGISWTLFHLAKHKEYQDRCRREVEEVLQDRKEVTRHDIGKFPFITMCIKESMRCLPPVPRVMRSLMQDLTFPDGKTLPGNTLVVNAFTRLHRNRDIWPNPKVYDPYRFSSENSKNRHPYAFLPFSAGPRNCIGQNFAMNEMKVAVALILQRFRLELDDTKPPAVPDDLLTTQAKSGIWVKLHPIDKSQ